MVSLLKLVIVLVLVAMIFTVIYLRASGRKSRHRHPSDVVAHRRGANVFIVSTLLLIASVLALEWEVRGSDFIAPPTPVLAIHLGAAGVFLTVLISMRIHVTGIRYPWLHRKLATRALIPSLGIMAITGLMLLGHL